MKASQDRDRILKVKDFFTTLDILEVSNSSKLRRVAEDALDLLDQGKIKVYENGEVQLWVKTAILCGFRFLKIKPQNAGIFQYQDKLKIKARSRMKDVRVLPGAVVRYGAFIEAGAILMPSFVNIGARVGSGTMVDTWATVGSCAQIGRNVHLSGGVGIGGVLEPLQAKPVIIEDGVFIGSRVVIVEGVHVEKEAVVGAGVVVTSSTKIIDVRGSTPVTITGRIPTRSVVIPGTTAKQFPAGIFQVPCALIIGERKASTDLKTSLNEALRNYHVSV